MATTVQTTDLVDYWQDAATQTLPTYTELTSSGFAQDGDPVTGQRATLPGAPWFNLIAAMRVSLIKAAGLTPSTTPDPLQFLTALQSMAWMLDKKITQAMLADALISAAKLASSAVETAKIKDAAVTAAKLASNAVETAKIKDDAVTNAKIAAGVITFNRLAAAAIATQQQAEEGTANDVLMTPLRVAQLLSEQMPPAVPTGMILPFLGTSVPEGFLLCNGSNVSRTTYANLFSVIGTRCGAGDGSTTFTLPNLHRRFAEFSTTLSEIGKTVEEGLPNISGSIIPETRNDDTLQGEFLGAFSQKENGQKGATSTDYSQGVVYGFTFSASSSNAIYGKVSTVQPSALRVLPCIKI